MNSRIDLLASQKGFTLVESMIVVLLIGIILFKGIPFTTDWVNNAKVTDVGAVLDEAVGLAKAKALRNSMGIVNGSAITTVCLSGNVVKVFEAQNKTTPAGCTNSSKQIWQSNIPSIVTVKVATANFSCLCFDGKAQFNTLNTCSSCSGSANLTLSAGGINETVKIY